MRTISLILALALLTACGSSGTRADLSGTGKKSQVDGRVTGFGSIIVDGVRYPTPRVQVDVDGQTGVLLDLDVGMVVSVQVNAAGEAVFIRYRDNVEGPVSSVDVGAEQFVVLGQTVRVDELTTFDGVSLATLQVGDRVEVSGVVDADGAILASYVEREDDTQEDAEVLGNVRALDTASQRFQINALVVDYSAAQIEVTGGLRNGPLVQVEGEVDASSGVLIAREVESIDVVVRAPGDETPVDEDQELRVSGVVRELAADGSRFALNNFTVVVTADTELEGAAAQSLSERVRVEVEGVLNALGELVATEIELQPEVNFEIEGTVEAVDSASSTLTLLGGVSVRVTEETSFKDDSELELREFGLADLRTGDRVEIVGVSSGDDIVALRLEREDSDVDDDGDGERDGDKLRGAVSQVDANSQQFVVQGTTVQVGASTEFEGYADAADFFARVGPGDQVEVEGTYDAGSMILSAVEIEDRQPGASANANAPGQARTVNEAGDSGESSQASSAEDDQAENASGSGGGERNANANAGGSANGGGRGASGADPGSAEPAPNRRPDHAGTGQPAANSGEDGEPSNNSEQGRAQGANGGSSSNSGGAQAQGNSGNGNASNGNNSAASSNNNGNASNGNNSAASSNNNGNASNGNNSAASSNNNGNASNRNNNTGASNGNSSSDSSNNGDASGNTQRGQPADNAAGNSSGGGGNPGRA